MVFLSAYGLSQTIISELVIFTFYKYNFQSNLLNYVKSGLTVLNYGFYF